MSSISDSYLPGGDLRHKGIAVNNDRLLCATIPEVQLNTTTTSQQTLAVNLHRRLPRQLVTYQPEQNSGALRLILQDIKQET